MTQSVARIPKAMPKAVPAQYAYRLRSNAVRAFEPCPRKEPMQMRKLKYHVNTSVDGFILSNGGGFDAFSTQSSDSEQYLQSLHEYGVLLMGRGAYEARIHAEIAPYPYLMSYVFSRTLRTKADPQVEVVSDDAAAWVQRLKACPGKDLYLCGGARLAASLFKANLIDEVLVKVSPVLQGSGRRLLSELDADIALKRISGVAYDDGAVLLTYGVHKHGTSQAGDSQPI